MSPSSSVSDTQEPTTKWHRAPEALAAAARWKERCLLRDGSVLTNQALWTSDNLDYLDRYFVQNLDLGVGDFYGKLETQLAPAPASAKQLAAELLWLLFLFISDTAMGGATKRQAIKRVWEWSGEPLPSAEGALGAPLDVGVGRPGTAFMTMRWRELVFLIDAMRVWKRVSTEEQFLIAQDGYAFARWIDVIPSSKGRAFRHMLLYLLYPESFERVASGTDKKLIVRTLRQQAGEDPDAIDYKNRVAVDHDLARIRSRLGSRFQGESLDFYSSDVARLWRGSTTTPSPGSSPGVDLDKWYAQQFGKARVWLIAAGEGGRMWPEFERESIISVGFQTLGDISDYASREAVREALVTQLKLTVDPVNDSLAAWQFANEMEIGDYVIAKRGMTDLLGIGRITTEYRFLEERSEYQHLRGIKWDRTGSWTIPDRRRVALKTLTDFSQYKDWLHWAMPQITQALTVPAEPDTFPPFTRELALQGVFMPPEGFSAILDALGRKKAVILEGAPGVGKTFLARRLAYSLIGHLDPAKVEMVQFHQSYAYEDFIQGWRPAGQGFELRDGIFHRFCQRAAASPGVPHVFIIDEINRGNLSKVFGELMMLIEADKRGPENSIQLTYSKDDSDRFSVPPNVYMLGLMNTADRSLAMVDYALRRRFSFVRLEPAFGSDAFIAHLRQAGVEEQLIATIAKRMTELNREIREDHANLGPGFEIGHSYFVPLDGASQLGEEWYRSVVTEEIEPLLREYWFDQPAKVRGLAERLLQ